MKAYIISRLIALALHGNTPTIDDSIVCWYAPQTGATECFVEVGHYENEAYGLSWGIDTPSVMPSIWEH